MTSPNPTHAETPSTTPYRHLVRADADATVVTVGTFAAGQSTEGRYVAAAEACHGSFASGQEWHAAAACAD
jgi:hypothetical protein